MTLMPMRMWIVLVLPPPAAIPVLQAIPQVATAPVLVLVGAMMMGESTHIDWSNMLTAVPAFLTIVIQPFTFSIANGIYSGLVMAVLLWVLTGQFMEYISPAKEVIEEIVDDLETPILNGQYAQEQAEVVAQMAGVAGGQQATSAAAAIPAQQGIPIGAGQPPRGSYTGVAGSFTGSVGRAGRGTPYERGSFSMYINTFGSHTASPGRGLLGGSIQATSEEPEH